MRLEPGVFRAESRNEVIYALDCGGAYVLVDVGGEAGLSAKLDQLDGDDVDLDKMAAVLITHSHEDHAGALPRVCADFSPRVVAHRLAAERLSNCPAGTPIDRELVGYTVDHGDSVEVGELVFQVHHLPGHTPDSVAWQLGDRLFAGDVIFCDGGIGWMDFHWGSCVEDYRASLQRLQGMAARKIYPGHRESGTITRDTVAEALRRLRLLAEADGNPLAFCGRPAPRRSPDDRGKIVRLSTGASSA